MANQMPADRGKRRAAVKTKAKGAELSADLEKAHTVALIDSLAS